MYCAAAARCALLLGAHIRFGYAWLGSVCDAFGDSAAEDVRFGEYTSVVVVGKRQQRQQRQQLLHTPTTRPRDTRAQHI